MATTEIALPTGDQLRAAAAKHDLALSDDEVDDFLAVLEGSVATLSRLEELPEAPRPGPPAGERDPGRRATADEDPLNAFITRCTVRGAPDGPLAGVDVGVKDNIAVAGVEMTAASGVLEGYVPPADATVVSRLLAAGATIVGKLNMDDMAWSGTGDLGLGGPVLNPRAPDHVAGGSSAGCAAALVAGDVDLAIGTDQAGSIRFPAAWSGCVGLKPTHGLVPYTGIIASGPSYDHVGPMARTVPECARGLAAIAGPDPLDPRQRGTPVATDDYTDLPGAPAAVSVGVVEEGFGHGDASVDRTVRAALDAFDAAGADVRDVSVPWHQEGSVIWSGVTGEEGVAMARDERTGHYLQGYYDEHFLATYATARREHADRFPPTVRLKLAFGQYLMDEYHGAHHAKAQNLRRELARAYDRALADAGADVLAMPTTPVLAPPVAEGLSRVELLRRVKGGPRGKNTSPFDVTGHPAISVPCGSADGLPVGLMLVAARFDDAGLLRAADAFERAVGWEPV